MNREQFLQQPDVASFIRWISENVPQMNFHLQMVASKFVPGGLDVEVRGMEAVAKQYKWNAAWTHPLENQIIRSCDWASTRQSLQQLRQLLRDALAANDQQGTCNACLSILEWGGVRGARKFLQNQRDEGKLVSYLQQLAPLFALNGNQALEELNEDTVLRFDAGLTKIHALLDQSGSPIYDSRVGAAIAMLYALYRVDSPAITAAVLKFPSGPARGDQIRDPGLLGFLDYAAPQFFTQRVSGATWAQYQLKLGWILQAVLQQTQWFSDQGDLPSRLHAFEASLFMLGYDLNRMVPDNTNGNCGQVPAKTIKQAGENWVPTSYPFKQTIEKFAAYRTQFPVGATRAGFKTWLKENSGLASSAAGAYTYPLREDEFGILDFSPAELDIIVKGGEDALFMVYESHTFELADERVNVCLVDAWLTGRCWEIQKKYGIRPTGMLLTARFAGTDNSVNALVYVGKNVGRHFGLLDDENLPTPLFKRFFGDALSDFDERLEAARIALQGRKT